MYINMIFNKKNYKKNFCEKIIFILLALYSTMNIDCSDNKSRKNSDIKGC